MADGFKCEKCGNDRFTARQQCYHDVIVDRFGQFEEDVEVTDSSKPYGPFQCTECQAEYNEIDV